MFRFYVWAEALALSDRIAVLSHGRIEQIGTPAEIYERPASAFVAEFIGSSNMLRARIVERSDERTIVATEAGLRLSCCTQASGSLDDSDVVSVLLRPERIWRERYAAVVDKIYGLIGGLLAYVLI